MNGVTTKPKVNIPLVEEIHPVSIRATILGAHYTCLHCEAERDEHNSEALLNPRHSCDRVDLVEPVITSFTCDRCGCNRHNVFMNLAIERIPND